MCGITGIMAFNEVGRVHMINLQGSIDVLSRRGPDAQDSLIEERTGLGHRRLSVIDLSAEANQPMTDPSGRYSIVYNGEIYNYMEIRKELESRNISFKTHSDTEVLLNSYMYYGEDCLQKLNGFFAFCIFDKERNEFFLARDRFGIKPLYYYFDEDKFLFASELKSLLAYNIEKTINYNALFFYLQLNYIPAPLSIINGVYKLNPGCTLKVSRNKIEIENYYSIPFCKGDPTTDYSYIKNKIVELLDNSVQRRLIADVPLGVFLSGGIDSSIITALASRHTEELKTFSIGYKDQPYFDETRYSRLVADHFKTKHTEIRLTTNDIYRNLFDVIDYIDEPFADSSALPVYILSQNVRKEVTVALSGDGADELFGGYNKHMAFHKSFKNNLSNKIIKHLHPLAGIFPSSRNSILANKIRQFKRYGSGLRMDLKDRYWYWASLNTERKALDLLSYRSRSFLNMEDICLQKMKYINSIGPSGDINSILTTDLGFILPNDMLFKIDLMSMANSLEIRVPFLDHDLVAYVQSLPGTMKVDNRMKKKVLQDAFHDILPGKLYKRPKQGFEVPLLKWFRTELKSLIINDLLRLDFIKEQGIFNPGEVAKYRRKLFSLNPGDVPAHIWGLIVFQWWWKKYFS